MDIINSLKGKKKVRVRFVCLGNICRSPAADGIMQSIIKAHGDEERWVIDSAGTGGYHVGDLPDNRMRIHARRRGYELNHICRQVRLSDFDEFDLIIPMDANNEINLRRISPSVEKDAKIQNLVHHNQIYVCVRDVDCSLSQKYDRIILHTIPLKERFLFQNAHKTWLFLYPPCLLFRLR